MLSLGVLEDLGTMTGIVGRSAPGDRAPHYLGLVHGYDQKPKRPLFEVLKS